MGKSLKCKRSLCVGSAKRIYLDEPPHFEAHFFALDVVVLVIASQHSDQFEPLTAIEIYRRDIARLRFEDEHSAIALLRLLFGEGHQLAADAPSSRLFVNPKFGHSDAFRPLFVEEFDRGDQLALFEHAVRDRAVKVVLIEPVREIVFALVVADGLYVTDST